MRVPPTPPLGPYRAKMHRGEPPRTDRRGSGSEIAAALIVLGLAAARLVAFAFGRDRPRVDAPMAAGFAVAALFAIANALRRCEYGRDPP